MQKGANFTHCLYNGSDWSKHQILRNLRKAACLLIPFFLLNFFLTKSRLSLSSTEILCAEHVNCKLFLAVVSNSCDWSKSFNTRNTHKSGV